MGLESVQKKAGGKQWIAGDKKGRVKGRDWLDHKQEDRNTKDNIKGGEVG